MILSQNFSPVFSLIENLMRKCDLEIKRDPKFLSTFFCLLLILFQNVMWKKKSFDFVTKLLPAFYSLINNFITKCDYKKKL